MFRVISGILSVLVFLNVQALAAQCISKDGRSKLMPFGVHLMGLQKTQDSLQLAILSTKYTCIEQGDKSNIEFSDGTFIYLSNLLELNCDGKAYFNLSKTDILALGTKEISKVVLGSKFKGYTSSAFPIDQESMEFRNLVNCILSEEISENFQIENQDIEIPSTGITSELKELVEIPESNPTINTQTSKAPLSVSAPLPPMRYIQFIASSGGKSYSELSHLGTIISEQVANKNLYRYKIQGQFSDTDIERIIASLAAKGFNGAFESK